MLLKGTVNKTSDSVYQISRPKNEIIYHKICTIMDKSLGTNLHFCSFWEHVRRECNVTDLPKLVPHPSYTVETYYLQFLLIFNIVFSVFMWRNHIPKLNITRRSFSGFTVSSDKRPYRNLPFHNVFARQSCSYCNRARLNFQAFAFRDLKIATREGCRVGQKMSYHVSFY